MPEITPSAEYLASRLPESTSISVRQICSASAMNARGGPRSRRPGARSRLPPLGALALANEAAGEGVFKRFSTARQAWIGHEILVRIERLLAGHRLYAGRSAIRQEFPTLLIVLE